ncbi:MAG: Wax ester synthase/acyl-CoA:diacylglycerol acyltransferase; Diacyglycerol O-acyltransferase, partial [uncultured Pseudonocardia sp.]
AAPALAPRRLVPVPGAAHHADARRRRIDLQAAPCGLRLRHARPVDRAAHRARAALPAEGPARAGEPGPPGVGGRRRLRPGLPRPPLRAAQAGLGRAAHRARGAPDVPAAGRHPPAVGDVPGGGRRGRAHGGDHQDAPGDGRRGQRDRHRAGDPRRRRARRRVRRPPRAVDAAARAHRPAVGVGRGRRSRRPARRGRGERPHGGRGRRRHRRSDRRWGGAAVHDGPHGEPARAGHAAERRHLLVPALRDRAHRAGGLPPGAGRARLHRQRRRPVGGGRCPAQLAALPRRGRDVVVHPARHGAAVGARRGGRAELGRVGRQPGGVVHRRPAGGGAEPGGAVAPRQPRDARAHGGRSLGGGVGTGPGGRLRPAHTARAGGPRRQRDEQADLQPGRLQRARPPVPAVRGGGEDAGDVPGGAAGEGAGPRHRTHLLRRRRLLRVQRRPRRHVRHRRPRRPGGRGAGRTPGDGAFL